MVLNWFLQCMEQNHSIIWHPTRIKTVQRCFWVPQTVFPPEGYIYTGVLYRIYSTAAIITHLSRKTTLFCSVLNTVKFELIPIAMKVVECNTLMKHFENFQNKQVQETVATTPSSRNHPYQVENKAAKNS